MRVGWFGGSFDPPHRGHLAVARSAADAFELDLVVWAPVGRQPLKGEAGAGFADRVAMVGLACEEDGRFRVSVVDAPREDGLPNYTVDTLGALRAEYGGAEMVGIVGMDAYQQMGQWREPERLRAMTDWIVVTRPGFALGGESAGAHFLETVWVDVSATVLRERLRAGEDCSEWMSERVLRYIAALGLYRAV